MELERRQLAFGALTGAAYLLFVALTTDLVDNPVFGREVAPTWWSWPALALTTVLVAWLAATYVLPRAGAPAAASHAAPRKGVVGAALTSLGQCTGGL